MTGVVVAENGGTVKLRQKPSTSCPYYEDIPVGTQVTILERGSAWSRLTTGGLTGWMKNEFIQIDGDAPVIPDPDAGDDVDVNQLVNLLVKIQRQLSDISEEIALLIGRG